MNDELTDLKPCPYCGGSSFQDDFSLNAFICDGCGAVGPEGNRGEYEGERKSEYADLWNTRTPPKVKPISDYKVSHARAIIINESGGYWHPSTDMVRRILSALEGCE